MGVERTLFLHSQPMHRETLCQLGCFTWPADPHPLDSELKSSYACLSYNLKQGMAHIGTAVVFT